MKNNIIFLQIGKDFLSNFKPVSDFVKSWHIKNSEPDLFAVKLMNDSLIEADLLGNLVEAVGDKDRGISGQESGSSGFTSSRTTKDEKVKISNRLHRKYDII